MSKHTIETVLFLEVLSRDELAASNQSGKRQVGILNGSVAKNLENIPSLYNVTMHSMRETVC